MIISYRLREMGTNKRQAGLISELFLQDGNGTMLPLCAEKQGIVRQTASEDLRELIRMGLIQENKSTKPYRYAIGKSDIIDDFLKNNTL